MIPLIFIIAVIALAAGGPQTDPYVEGRTAYARGDDVAVAAIMRPLAEQGDVKAQAFLGNLYAQGRGVPRDNAEAVKWIRKAAEQGHAQAQFYLGRMYRSGVSVAKDPVEAADWFRKGAEQGDRMAQSYLGYMYTAGEGVPGDYAEALRWLRLAAEKGEGSAQTWLAIMYAEGWGVEQDFVRVHMWSRVALSSIPESDKDKRGVALKLQREAAAEITPEQLKLAENMAQKCMLSRFTDCE